MTAARRLPSVALRNWRGGDPRARRRFVTSLGDGLRERGAVAIEALAEDTTAVLDQLLAAVGAYFGLAANRFASLCGEGDPGSGIRDPLELGGADSSELVVASLWIPEADAGVAIDGEPVRLGTAVLVVGPALAGWTGNILVPVPVSFSSGAGKVQVLRSTVAGPLAEFVEPTTALREG